VGVSWIEVSEDGSIDGLSWTR